MRYTIKLSKGISLVDDCKAVADKTIMELKQEAVAKLIEILEIDFKTEDCISDGKHIYKVELDIDVRDWDKMRNARSKLKKAFRNYEDL